MDYTFLFQAKAQEVKRVKVTPLKKETPLKTSLRGRKKIVVQGKFIGRYYFNFLILGFKKSF